MIVLGFDPGTATTGYGVISVGKNKQDVKVVTYGCLKTSNIDSDAQRLKEIYESAIQLVDLYVPDVIVIEKLFFNKNVKTASQVNQSKGVLMLASSMKNIPLYEYTPLQVKQSVVGIGNAGKAQVQYMVKQICRLENKLKSDDAADALAVAICHLSLTSEIATLRSQ